MVATSSSWSCAWPWLRPESRRFLLGLGCLLATNAAALALPLLLGNGVQRMASGGGLELVLPVAWTMAGAAAVLGATRVMSRVFLFNVGRDIEYALRKAFYAALCRQTAAYMESSTVGDLMTRATGDMANVRSMFGFAALNLINTALVYLGNIPLLFRLDARLAVCALLPFPLVLLAIRVVTRSVFVHVQRAQEDQAALTSRLHQHLEGMDVVRAFAQQEAESQRFAQLNQQLFRSSLRVGLVRNLLGPITGLMGAASAAVALWMGAARVMDGALTVGDLVEFNARLALLTGPTLALGWTMAVWQRGIASLARVHQVLDAPRLVEEPEHAVQPLQRQGAVVLENATVHNTRQRGTETVRQEVLSNITWAIPPGACVAVVGPTGSGKTTLARVLARVMDVQAGRVVVDGVDVRERALSDLRQDVALVPQEALLFDATLLENLRLGSPDATRDAVTGAAHTAGLAADISALPLGLDTVVGERGVTLSGGQRQRVALARALLRHPKVLVLDDTLAALDGPTQHQVMEALLALPHRPTVILITHRLAAARQAQDLLVLVDGHGCDHGTHEQLLARSQTYQALWGRDVAQPPDQGPS